MGLFDLLTGSRQVAGNPSVQPNPAKLPDQFFGAGHIVAIQTIPNPYTDILMETSPTGFSQPNPVTYAKTPVSLTISGVPDFRVSSAPSVKGCN